jgi:MFS family permease
MSVLGRYVASAVLARSADAGAGIGLLLLCVEVGRFERPALVGGLLVAALTAPHLVGPLLAARLDRSGDGRRLIAGAMVAFGALIGLATLVLGRWPIVVVVVVVALAGICGPMLAAGLGSRLGLLVGPDEHCQRRAEGWDAVTYGVAGSLGPAVVAAFAAAASPRLALLALAVAVGVAGALTLTLPPLGLGDREPGPEMTTSAVLQLLATLAPLRRVTYATMATALVLGGLSVIAVQFAPRLGLDPAAGAALATAFGLGNLAGSLLVTARPLRGESETLTSRWVAVIALALAGCALAPTFPLALVAFFGVGAANAPFFVATLAARSAYAPESGRARVFVGVAALKIAAGSAGTALAGVLSGVEPRLLLLAGGILVGVAAAASMVERRVAPAGG